MWSRSLIEEVIAGLWIISAVLAFGFGFKVWGWIFAIKGAMDTVASIVLACREILKKARAEANH